MPTISFVVIAYNVQRYIAACLRSLQTQTSGDFEVIVVDDASTDDTRRIVQSTCLEDDRFVLIAKDVNEGAHLARRTGVSHTTGRYVIFVDGDDCMQDTACEVLANVAAGRDFDILRFGRTLVPQGEANERTALQEERAFNLTTDDMQSSDVLKSVFSENFSLRNTWSLIDCMFNGDFVRQGFAAMTEEPLGRMQDSYEFFVLASRARSMKFFTEYRALRYNFGTGVSGNGLESLQKFERGHTGIHASMNAVLQYAAHKDNATVYCAQWYKHTVLGIVGREWVTRLTEEDQAEGIRSLREEWGDENTAYMLLDPLIARAQWFVEHDAVPSEDDPYSRWTRLFNSLDLQAVTDSLIQQRIDDFRLLRQELIDREQHRQEELREESLRRQQEELRRQREMIEQRRLLKSGTVLRRVVDRCFPEGGMARKTLRTVARWILRR